MSETDHNNLSGNDAELLGRHIFTAFMNLIGYGASHPMSQKSIDSAFAALEQAAKKNDGITLLLDRDRLYLENHSIGTRFNPQRLIKIMGELNLESVLFKPGIDQRQFIDFLNVLGSPQDWPTLESMRSEMARRNIKDIKLNYVFYRKVTDDEEIVSGDKAERTSSRTQAPDDLSPLLADLMSRIHENPSEAARLVALAAESHDGDDDDQLVQSLTRYIGRLSRKLAAEENAGRAPPDESTIKEQLHRFQQELIETMSLGSVNARLAERVEERLAQANLQPEKPTMETGIPERVMNASSMAFFLNREVKSALRYETPFACAMITIDQIIGEDGQPRKPHQSELDQLLPNIYRLLFRLLRDLDLIGSLDRNHRAVPLIIMPMTPHGNANIVRLRLEEALDNARFDMNGQTLKILTTVTTLGFHPKSDQDLRGYMTKLRHHHARARTEKTG